MKAANGGQIARRRAEMPYCLSLKLIARVQISGSWFLCPALRFVYCLMTHFLSRQCPLALCPRSSPASLLFIAGNSLFFVESRKVVGCEKPKQTRCNPCSLFSFLVFFFWFWHPLEKVQEALEEIYTRMLLWVLLMYMTTLRGKKDWNPDECAGNLNYRKLKTVCIVRSEIF